VYDSQDAINQVKDEMAECEIPSNISKRRNEVNQFDERFKILKNEFKDLK